MIWFWLIFPTVSTTQNKWDTIIDLEKLWAQYKRIAKPNAAIVLTAAQPFTSVLVMSNLREFKYQWVWQKTKPVGFLNAKRQPLRAHEDVLVFCAKQSLYYPQKTTGHKPYRVTPTKPENNGSNYGSFIKVLAENSGERNPISVVQFGADPNKVHPTQKPVALMEYLIKTYTHEGMTVLDNCMGSGTTGVACARTNRNFIGIEQDENYFNIARERITKAQDEAQPISLQAMAA